MGIDEYKRQQAEYMKEYRAKQRELIKGIDKKAEIIKHNNRCYQGEKSEGRSE